MSLEQLGGVLLSSVVLFLAHCLRAVRWAQLFSPTELTRRFHLLLGLALGYTLNAIAPLRAGEILRMWYVSRKDSVRFSYVAATVVAERLSDLLVVAVLVAWVLSDRVDSTWSRMVWVPIVLLLALVLTCVAVQRSEPMRRWIWRLASVFNDGIRFGVADFFWSLSELVVGGGLLRPQFLLLTALMWAAYLGSYALFASTVEADFGHILVGMFGAPLRPAYTRLLEGWDLGAVAMLIFTGMPVLVVLLYGLIKQWPVLLRLLEARHRFGGATPLMALGGARHHFKAESEYHYFLASLFSGHNKAASRFGLEALDDGTVHKLFGGGSDAITALVESGEKLVIRKFASGSAAGKLSLQQEWLVTHRSADMPLVEVVGGREKGSIYYYDMPLVSPASDFYDFIHSNPVESSRLVLEQVLESVARLHERRQLTDVNDQIVDKYLQEKAVGNARQILDFANSVLPSDRYTINGAVHDLADWERFLDTNWLRRQITRPSATVVHGDLTIENVIVSPGYCRGWYIIDPNPDNIFNTELIDWAKMLQSLHLGYEGLNRNHHCVLEGSAIRMAFARSQAYAELHSFLERWLLTRYGEDGLREAYFHELIHYLRLVPYKIRQSPHKGFAFFSCTSVLLKEYLSRWP